MRVELVHGTFFTHSKQCIYYLFVTMLDFPGDEIDILNNLLLVTQVWWTSSIIILFNWIRSSHMWLLST